MPAQPVPPVPTVSAWAPKAITAFRVLWFARLGSNIGSWMQTVGARWFLVEAAREASADPGQPAVPTTPSGEDT